jgi:N-acyl-D-amino-acid deacylase
LDKDLVITDGRIVDGTGNPWFRGDIAIRNGKIAEIGRIGRRDSTSLNAEGLVVSPGFIDAHSHTDMVLHLNPMTQSTIRQGITTMVVGNCGMSLAPVSTMQKSLLEKSLSQFMPRGATIDLPWRTFREYMKHESDQKKASNIAYLVGHGTIRTAVMGYENRNPTTEELEQMKDYVAEAMAAGAVGLSSGLIYPPGMFADSEELIALARVSAGQGGVYTSHIRGEAGTLVEAVGEALRIGEVAQVPVHISHHKAMGKRYWGDTDKTLAMISEARIRGVDATLDQYPYEAGMTSLATLLPPWAHEGGMQMLLDRLRSPEARKRMAGDIETGLPGWVSHARECGYENIVVSSLTTEANRGLEGKNLIEIAEARKAEDVTTALLDLLLEEKGQATMILFCMGEDDIRRVMTDQNQMVGTDSWAVAPSGIMASGKPHPRFYGTYPRILGHYVRETNVLRLEEAVRKMTSFPAQRFQLRMRGLLAPGYWADIVVFDPTTVTDRASYQNPHQYPEGIRYVLVNGEIVIRGSENTGALPGKSISREQG